MKKRLFLISCLSSFVLLSSPVQAAKLQSWYFDTAQNRLHLTTDSGIKPQAFLIDNPKRLVIDLPGTQINSKTIKKQFGTAVKEIRVGQVDNQTTRLVVELAPGYSVSPENVLIKGDTDSHWIVRFSSLERVAVNDSPFGEENRQEVPIQPIDTSLFAGVMPLGQEISALESRIRTLMSRYSSLSPGMFFLDLQTGNYIDINGEKVFSAASTIKFPILVALFEEVDAGRIKLNDKLVMRRDLVAGEAGTMQYKPVGTRFTVLDTVTKMITISDNTATNMIIDRLGGAVRLNQRFRSWGLQNTVVRRLLPDVGGKNTTSAKDLVRLSAKIANNGLLTDKSRAQVFNIMRRVQNRRLLPAGLGSGAVIAHKTGTLRFIIGDAGIIEMPSGRRYLAGILVRRPNHDTRARDFVSQVSRLVYGYLDQPNVTHLP